MSANHSLFIKYGLRRQPSDQQVQEWLNLVDQLVASGYARELAGEQAARQIFPDFNSMVYASQADTIEALLAAARKKD